MTLHTLNTPNRIHSDPLNFARFQVPVKLLILFIKYIRDGIKKRKYRIAFDKNMAILMRLNGFFVGSIGINMVITGVNNLFVA